MRYLRIAIALLLLPSAAPRVFAQQATAPEPILNVSIDPARVVVGQKALLRVEVMAPNYMTSPPELPGFQVRNAVTRQLQNVNTNDERNGISYAGVRFEFAIYPQEPGAYAISDQKLTVRYAAEPPATRETVLAVPPVAFEAFIPDAASALHPFVAASRLSAEQTVQRSSEQLKSGDAVTRTVTIKAEGLPAMLLPPQTLVAIDGMALYPAQPSLQDHVDGRTDAMTSTRIDSATYMLQRPGNYILPAIDIAWWNTDSGKIERIHLDEVPLAVAANPAEPMAGGATGQGTRWSVNGIVDLVAEHWLVALLAFIVLAAIAWFAPRASRIVAANWRRRRAAYLQSEEFSFDQLRHAARGGDARATYFALLDWLQRFEPAAPDHTIHSLKAAAKDAELDSELRSMERQLFAPPAGAGDWSPRRLLRRVKLARRNLRRQAVAVSARRQLPSEINPAGGVALPGRIRRLPAR
ncbi:BatD family protein [Bradyrhizobium paxllaeri]|uniref:BatD family protein n=1 Tax=Bradyrhizobium paxllaeri TaxID=190148 RepID=UPI000810A772|nr:BatD family protein [Bradyrhizobium paxllaeri]